MTNEELRALFAGAIAPMEQDGGLKVTAHIRFNELLAFVELVRSPGQRPVPPDPSAVPDTLEVEARMEMRSPRVQISIAKTMEALQNAPLVIAESTDTEPTTIRQSVTVEGVFWPTPNPPIVTLREFGGTVIKGLKLADTAPGVWEDKENRDLWRDFSAALIARNHRNAYSPLIAHHCPECGELFQPKRRGQVYHSRACADRAGHRRRYRERKRLIAAQ